MCLQTLVMAAPGKDGPHVLHDAVAYAYELVPSVDQDVLLRAEQEELVSHIQ